MKKSNMTECDECGKLIKNKAGLFSTNYKIEDKLYCFDCGNALTKKKRERICGECGITFEIGLLGEKKINDIIVCKECAFKLNNSEKIEFMASLKPLLDDEFTPDETIHKNVKIIKFLNDYCDNNRVFMKLSRDGSKHNGIHSRVEISNQLEWIFKKCYLGSNHALAGGDKVDNVFFDIKKEIPLIFISEGGSMMPHEWMIFTNSRFYYRLCYSKKAQDSGNMVSGKINYEDIESCDLEYSNLLLTGIRGRACELIINGNTVGAFQDLKITGDFLKILFHTLIGRKDELLDIVKKPSTPILPNSEDVTEKIKKIKSLFDDGILTDEEFKSKKTELLASL